MDERLQTIVDRLHEDLSSDLGGARFPNPEGWRLESVALRTFRKTVPVVTLKLGERTLCFIVTPTDPEERVYRRTAVHDLVYFSEDVPDEEQGVIYARDRAMIDGFCAWMTRRDEAVRPA